MSEAADQGQAQEARPKCDCPLCALSEMTRRWRGESKAFSHFHNAHVEVLKGVRAFLDECINKAETPPEDAEPRVTKIQVD